MEEYTLWNGFRRLDFKFEGRDAILVFPDNANKTDRWALKTEYFNAFPATEIELVRRGYHLAYLKNLNRWGTDPDHHCKRRFADWLGENYGLRKRFVSVGMSCGGIHAVNFASRYPEYCSCLYLDAPVMNLLSTPVGVGKRNPNIPSAWHEVEQAYGFTLSDIISYREHPIDRMNILTDNHIPVALICGDADDVVPFEENGMLLKQHYERMGAPLFFRLKPGCGHHPHGLEDPTPLCDFIEQYGI